MKKKILFLMSISGAALAFAVSSGSAATQTTCDRDTAIRSLSADTLCGCDVVTRDMLKYIQGHELFAEVLEATSSRCPGFAAVLADQPTASIGGNPNGTNGGGDTIGYNGGGSNGGGSNGGGSNGGGSTDGGSTDGGSTDGGSTDGGSTDGGSTDGGSTDGGSTDGGEPPKVKRKCNNGFGNDSEGCGRGPRGRGYEQDEH